MKFRSYKLLKTIIRNDKNYPVKVFADKFNVSERTIHYDVEELNKTLKNYNCQIIHDSEGLAFESDESSDLQKALISIKNDIHYSRKYRVKLIILELLKAEEPMIINQFMTLLNVSRGTILKDLKNVEKELNEKDLELMRKQNYGFEIFGDEVNFRDYIIKFLNDDFQFVEFVEFSENTNYDISLIEEEKLFCDVVFKTINLEKIKELVDYIETEIGYKFSDKSYYHIYLYLAITVVRIRKRNYLTIGNELYIKVKKTSEYKVSLKAFHIIEELFDIKMSQSEVINLALKILSSGVSTDFTINKEKLSENNLSLLAKQMIKIVENTLEIKLNDEELENGLVLHLKALVNRLSYHYESNIKNPLLDEIKTKYADVFNATKHAMMILETTYNCKINDHEISYISMHFGAAFERRKRLFNSRIKAVVVCPSGVGTSSFLISKLSKNFNDLNIVAKVSLKELKENILKFKNYDLIITTVNLPYAYDNIIKISPTFTSFEKFKLTELINKIKTEEKESSNRRYNFALDDFYNHIKSDFILKGNAIEFKKKLYMYFREKNISVEYNEALGEQIKRKGLLELLGNKIVMNNEKLDWKAAIVKASTPLLDEKSIKEGYIDEIFALVESKGPYFIITPGVALVHSKPSESVEKTSIALMVSKEAIAFNEEKSVKIMIMLALKDNKEHLLAMTDILTLFEKDETVNKIIESDSVEAISSFLLSYLKK